MLAHMAPMGVPCCAEGHLASGSHIVAAAAAVKQPGLTASSQSLCEHIPETELIAAAWAPCLSLGVKPEADGAKGHSCAAAEQSKPATQATADKAMLQLSWCRPTDDETARSDADSGEQEERRAKQKQAPKRKGNRQRKRRKRSGSAGKRKAGTGGRPENCGRKSGLL